MSSKVCPRAGSALEDHLGSMNGSRDSSNCVIICPEQARSILEAHPLLNWGRHKAVCGRLHSKWTTKQQETWSGEAWLVVDPGSPEQPAEQPPDPSLSPTSSHHGFPGGSDGKESACNAGDLSLIPQSRRSGEGNGNPLQYSCLDNPRDRGTWQATVHGVKKEVDMTERPTLSLPSHYASGV